jgi:small-conductance mechanosensitive channel
LRFIALSIAAFAVALVVATREQIQCFLGALYIAGSRAFGVGDWIKVSHYHGEVVSSDLLTTTLLEVDIEDKSYSYTGKTLVVPNNLFVGGVVQNLNFMRRYVSHSFSITKENNPIDIRLAREFLISRAEFYCEPFKNVAERYGSLIENRLGVSLGMDSASVRVTTNSTAKNVFIISFFCPTQEAVHIEQKILEDFFDYWDKSAKKVKISERNKDDGEIHDLNHHE